MPREAPRKLDRPLAWPIHRRHLLLHCPVSGHQREELFHHPHQRSSFCWLARCSWMWNLADRQRKWAFPLWCCCCWSSGQSQAWSLTQVTFLPSRTFVKQWFFTNTNVRFVWVFCSGNFAPGTSHLKVTLFL